MTNLSSNKSLDCTSFEERIHRILDDRLTLTGDELLMGHASQCAKCAKLLNDYESVDDSVKLLPGEIAKILSEAREFDVTNGLGSFASRHFGLISTLAALVVIGIGVFNILNSYQSEIAIRRAMEAPSANSNAFGHQFAKTINPTPRSKSHRKTPDTSPFSRNFSVANSISLVSLPSVPSWDDVAKGLDPLEPVITYSAEIPGIRPMQGSFNATLQLLKKSFSKSDQVNDPDLGFSSDFRMLAAA